MQMYDSKGERGEGSTCNMGRVAKEHAIYKSHKDRLMKYVWAEKSSEGGWLGWNKGLCLVKAETFTSKGEKRWKRSNSGGFGKKRNRKTERWWVKGISATKDDGS